MMTYRAVSFLQLAKGALKDHVYTDDLQESASISAQVQDALDFALLLIQDFREAENEAFDVGWQAAAGQLKSLDWSGTDLLRKALSPHPYTVAELASMEAGQWVWIEWIGDVGSNQYRPKTGYYKSHPDITAGESFCCGYPGLDYEWDFSEYGHSWLAYPNKPFPKGGQLH